MYKCKSSNHGGVDKINSIIEQEFIIDSS